MATKPRDWRQSRNRCRVAIELVKAGADVAVNYRERADAANTVCAEINGMGRKSIAVQADGSVSGDVRRMVAEIETHLGSTDVLVNSAGMAHPRKLEDITKVSRLHMLFRAPRKS